MPYESMPDVAELIREAEHMDPSTALLTFSQGETLPATVPARAKRSAEFVLALCELTGQNDPESAFRDALREMQHAAVEFGANWTQEERFAWRDVQDERARLECPGAYRLPSYARRRFDQ
jgi:hypothetical protein